MSKPVFEDVFRLSGRRNRQSYVLLSTIAFAIVLAISLLIGALAQVAGGSVAGLLAVPLAVAACALMVATTLAGAQRCRDFGWTGWAVVITLMPVVGFVFGFAMLLVPGTQGENRYGPDPTRPAQGAQGQRIPAT